MTTVYARIEIDDTSLVDMTPEGFAENLGEIIHQALEPLADVSVTLGQQPTTPDAEIVRQVVEIMSRFDYDIDPNKTLDDLIQALEACGCDLDFEEDENVEDRDD